MKIGHCWLRLTATAMLLAIGCSRQLPEVDFERVAYPGETAAPILLVGLDGLEWNVVLSLIEKGEMPTLEGLMERGSYGLLETSKPTWSPVIWTTIATGKDRQDHGIRGFTKPASAGTQELYTSSDRKTKALWNILSDYRKRVATIGWWMTYPVERINGVMIAQTNTTSSGPWKGTIFEGLPRQVWPSIREEELWSTGRMVEQELPGLTRKIFGEFPNPMTPVYEGAWKDSQWSFRADNTYLRLTESLLQEREPYDLVMAYFGATDVVGHRFWREAYPEGYKVPPSAEQVENFGHVIADCYRYADTALGELLTQIDDQWTIIVVSDHGMGPANRNADFDAEAVPSGHHFGAPPGVFIAAGPVIKQMGMPPEGLRRSELLKIGSIYDLTPTILALLRIPIGKDMPGTVISTLIKDRFRLENQPEPVSTHDTRRFLASRPGRDSQRAKGSERLEQLRNLGYIQ